MQASPQIANESLSAASGSSHLESNRPTKRYSSLRQRGNEHTQNMPSINDQRGMQMQMQDPNMMMQMPPPDDALQSQNSQYTHKNAPASNYGMPGIDYNPQIPKAAAQPPQQQPVPPVVPPNQYQPNFYPNEYPHSIPSPQMNQVGGGPPQVQYAQPAPYLPSPQANPAFMQQPPPQTQPLMNFVPPPPVVPSLYHPPVQNYNATVRFDDTNMLMLIHLRIVSNISILYL